MDRYRESSEELLFALCNSCNRLVIGVIRDFTEEAQQGGISMNEKERLNALEVALNNEMREREFYLKNAKRSKNPLGKAMFQQIGDDELEHYERLKQLHQKWNQTGKMAWYRPSESERYDCKRRPG